MRFQIIREIFAMALDSLRSHKLRSFLAMLGIIIGVGAVIAAGLLLFIASGKAGYSLAVNGLGQNGFGAASPAGYSLAACAIAEVPLTATFFIVVFGALSR